MSAATDVPATFVLTIENNTVDMVLAQEQAPKKMNVAILEKKAMNAKIRFDKELAAKGNNAILTDQTPTLMCRRVSIKSSRKPLRPPANKNYDNHKAIMDAKLVHTARRIVVFSRPMQRPEQKPAASKFNHFFQDIVGQRVTNSKIKAIFQPVQVSQVKG